MSELAYVDTSVVIARYKPNDPLHRASGRLFSQKPAQPLKISPVTLIELCSVIARLRSRIRLPKEAERMSVETIVEFMIEDCSLSVESAPSALEVNSRGIRIALEYLVAMKLAEDLKLRALDLLHIAYASILVEKMQTLITGDQEILERGDAIQRITNIKVQHPKDL